MATDGQQSNKLARFDFVYTETERMVDLQFSQIDGLDTKAGFVLGAGSFLISGYAIAQTWAASEPARSRTANLAHGFLHWGGISMALLYFGVALFSFLAYRLGSYDVPPNPAILAQVWKAEQAEPLRYEPREEVLAELFKAHAANERRIKRKTRWANMALWLFLVESLCLAGLLFLVSL